MAKTNHKRESIPVTVNAARFRKWVESSRNPNAFLDDPRMEDEK